jgi:peptidoglycan/LPS O-acetylase OafA/YrhL
MYLVLALAVLLTLAGILPGTVRATTVLLQSAHLTNYYVVNWGWWDGLASGTWIYWSLAVEEHFYLVFPLVYIALRRLSPSARVHALVLLGACAVVLAWRVALVFLLDATKDRTYVATDTRIDSILFGCVLGVYANPMLDPTRISERAWKWLWLPVAAALLVFTFGFQAPGFTETARYSLQGLALFPLFIVAIRYPNWPPARLLNLRPVALVGVISYSLYLLHPSVLYGVDQWLPAGAVVRGAVSLAITLSLASAIYLAIERPCARLRRRLSKTATRQVLRPSNRSRGEEGETSMFPDNVTRVISAGSPTNGPVPARPGNGYAAANARMISTNGDVHAFLKPE